MVVHVEKFNGLFWGSNDSMTSSVQVLETLFCKVDETHVTHEVVNTRRFAEAGLFFKLTSNTGSLGDSSDNTFSVLIVVVLVDSTPDSSGKISGSSDGTGEVSQETEVLKNHKIIISWRSSSAGTGEVSQETEVLENHKIIISWRSSSTGTGEVSQETEVLENLLIKVDEANVTNYTGSF